jgi:alpha-mannosidase
MWDFDTLHQVAEQFPDQSPMKNRAMYCANEIMNTFDYRDASSISRCRKVAEDVLGTDWEVKMEKEREGKKVVGVDKTGNLWGVGHCHIDTAWWVWTFVEVECSIERR